MEVYKISAHAIISNEIDQIIVVSSPEQIEKITQNSEELTYLRESILGNEKIIELNNYKRRIFVIIHDDNITTRELEVARTNGHNVYQKLAQYNIEEIAVKSFLNNKSLIKSLIEGIFLSDYRFDKYLSKPKEHQLKSIKVDKSNLNNLECTELDHILTSIAFCRDLVNEPVSHLTATELSRKLESEGKNSNFNIEVFEFEKVKSLKMGGLLAVNQGSIDPPTFNILEYKSLNATNEKPIILVGKGVVYDTGGLSLKPTEGSMDMMKCDMAGSAVVASTIRACALNNISIHIIGLIPATDNRPGGNAVAPGDVITMHSGKTVEVMNTDAEGRLILADALSYAKKYEPELVIDLATLTGSAIRAIGSKAGVLMGNASDKIKEAIIESGFQTHERLAELPFWDDYGDQLKSDIADLKNIGSSNAGAITAGKFLEHFVDYQWLHIDIAGPSYITSPDSYRGKNGTGFGVRMMYDFIKKYSENERG